MNGKITQALPIFITLLYGTVHRFFYFLCILGSRCPSARGACESHPFTTVSPFGSSSSHECSVKRKTMYLSRLMYQQLLVLSFEVFLLEATVVRVCNGSVGKFSSSLLYTFLIGAVAPGSTSRLSVCLSLISTLLFSSSFFVLLFPRATLSHEPSVV